MYHSSSSSFSSGIVSSRNAIFFTILLKIFYFQFKLKSFHHVNEKQSKKNGIQLHVLRESRLAVCDHQRDCESVQFWRTSSHSVHHSTWWCAKNRGALQAFYECSVSLPVGFNFLGAVFTLCVVRSDLCVVHLQDADHDATNDGSFQTDSTDFLKIEPGWTR